MAQLGRRLQGLVTIGWLLLLYTDSTTAVCDIQCYLCSGGISCEQCNTGYYLKNNGCHTCSSNCAKCSVQDPSQCYECVPGKYGTDCQTNCRSGKCVNNECSRSSGICTDGCKPRTYVYNNYHCLDCPANCATCGSSQSCYECDPGYWGSACQNECSMCNNNACNKTACLSGCIDGYYLSADECSKCPTNCTKCYRSTSCSECVVGKSGVTCERDCQHCIDNICSLGGKCTNECVDGSIYDSQSQLCYMDCTRCVNDGCSQNMCVDGCKDGYVWQTDRCSQCPIECSTCSSNAICTGCKDGFYLSDGSCLSCHDSCATCTGSDVCTGCKVGYYLKDSTCSPCQGSCELGCSTNCLRAAGETDADVCDTVDGRCKAGCTDGFYGDTCDEACGQCLDTTCQRSDGTCIYGCITGYMGLSCNEGTTEHVCDIYCYQCEGARCRQCNTEYYLKYNACYMCSPNCAKCSVQDPSQCYECVPGKYGTDCQTNCWSGKCVNNECSRSSGICTDGCKPRTYVYNNHHCLDCPANCATCGSSQSCYECDPGYWGSACRNECSMCNNNACNKTACLSGCIDGYYLSADECSKCPTNCTKCYRSTSCSECVVGKSGVTCERDCQHCIDNICSLGGKCTNGCVDGSIHDSQSQLCYMDCTRCVNDGCSQNMCVYGCKDGYVWQTDRCSQCPIECSTCSNNAICTGCKDGLYFSDGSCLSCHDPCTTCTGPDVCTGCKVGYYLTDSTCSPCQGSCELGCSSNCLRAAGETDADVCDTVDGICKTGCTDGFYGDTCDEACGQCLDTTCHRSDGTCISGCITGYMGLLCNEGTTEPVCDIYCYQCEGARCRQCNTEYYLKYNACYMCSPNCAKCSVQDPSQCYECVPGKYGTDCQTNCRSGKCVNNECGRSSGICTDGCKPRTYVYNNHHCLDCPSNCATCGSSQSCYECDPGYWGTACQNECSMCNNNACNKTACLSGCIDGYYLSADECSKCPTNCTKCYRSTSCSECVVGKSGLTCERDCQHCIDNICSRGGKCTNGCVDGSIYDSQSQLCYMDCTRCVNDGCSQNMCVYGCKDGYVWQTDRCSQCPIECSTCSSNAICTGCKVGFYLSDGSCLSCHDPCTTCTGYDGCTGCKVGYYLTDSTCSPCQGSCELGCSSNCLRAAGETDADVCDTVDGICKTGCTDGFYGDTCDEACGQCLDTTCHRSDGTCISGCITGYMGLLCNEGTTEPVCDIYCYQCEGARCRQCNTEYYLKYNTCYMCSPNCAKCSVQDPSQCYECVPGKYGTDCQTNCRSGKCVNNECSRSSGICTDGCIPRTYVYNNYHCLDCPANCATCGSSQSCYECDPGYWGSACQNECSMCKYNACNKTACLSGCIDGYYLSADECSKCPTNCTKCYRSTSCSECVVGKSGVTCERDCQHCIDNICSLGGKCTNGCVDGSIYDSQSQLCYMDCTRCVNDGCSQNMCVYGCKDGYVWQTDRCSQCPIECSTCSSNAICTGCKDGFYLSDGSCLSCHDHCTTCTGSDVCTGCNVGYYLTDSTCSPCQGSCEQGCSSNCLRAAGETDADVCDTVDGRCKAGCTDGFYGDTCNEACGQCLDTTCQRSDGTCIYGCITGYMGLSCNKGTTEPVCDIYCYQCEGARCRQCNTEYYLKYNACYMCSPNCAKCSVQDPSQCYECVPGKYGTDCQTNCRSGKCVNNECSRSSGICTDGCKPRTYVYANYYCYDCPAHCATCGSSQSCYECDPGYWGTACQNECSMCTSNACNKTACLSGCLDGYYLSADECSKCSTDCTKCYRSTSCSECVAGRWGGKCERDCQHCIDNDCNQSGKCTGGCVDGSIYDLQSQLCYMDCTRCVNDACSQNWCVDGCKEGYLWHVDRCSQCPQGCSACSSTTSCTGCKDGYYQSQHSCHLCHNGCSTCTASDICTGCKSGYSLNEKTCTTCSTTCSICSDLGECTECKDGSYLIDGKCSHCVLPCIKCTSTSQCTACSDGHYGVTCTTCTNCKAPVCDNTNGCTERTCDWGDGSCLHGCEDGWFSDKCNIKCSIPNCEVCSYSAGDFTCSACLPNYFKESETTCVQCSLHCAIGSVCDRISGSCSEGCIDGWQGSRCDTHCPTGCAVCSQADGACTVCLPGKYGNICDRPCSSGCQVDNGLLSCDKFDGSCPSGCVKGYWTRTCDILCNDGCLNSACDSSTGECLDGCMPMYFGTSCESRCSNNCLTTSVGTDTNICDRADGRCVAGCRDGYYADTCDEACGHCQDTICHRSDGTCVNGCLAGYSGLMCDEGPTSTLCDIHCSICSGISCQQCTTGYYLENNGCHTCSSNCAKCSGPDSSQCYKCMPGKYGTNCQTNCWSGKCVNNECNKSNGICTDGCIPRMYVSANYYCYDCPAHCTDCGSSQSCYECDPGYWGTACQNECNMCNNNACTKTACVSGCIDGYYLSADECSKCPTDCTKCYRSTSCSECVAGRWGGMCERDCQHCIDNDCSLSGKCTKGCVDGSINDSQSQLCYMDCTRCVNDACAQNSCVDGCKDGYFWQVDRCSQCPPNVETCNAECSIPNCQICTDSDGVFTCSVCLVNYFKESETMCVQCSLHCAIGSVCDRISGSCSEGCIDGWQGSRCDTQCPTGCAVCSQSDGACTACLPGKYGNICDKPCSSGCQVDNGLLSCDKFDGSCPSGCVKGYWTSTCDILCNDGCLNSACDSSTGECLDGCMSMYFGTSCESRCSNNCMAVSPGTDTNRCDRADGRCVAGCRDGYYGDTCDEACGHCQDIICHRSDGTCVHGCLTGYMGMLCNEAPSVAGQEGEEGESAATIGAAVGGAVVGIGIIVAVGIVLILRRRRSGGLPDTAMNYLPSTGGHSDAEPVYHYEAENDLHARRYPPAQPRGRNSSPAVDNPGYEELPAPR